MVTCMCHTVAHVLVTSHAMANVLVPSHAVAHVLVPSHAVAHVLVPSHAMANVLVPSHAMAHLLDCLIPSCVLDSNFMVRFHLAVLCALLSCVLCCPVCFTVLCAKFYLYVKVHLVCYVSSCMLYSIIYVRFHHIC